VRQARTSRTPTRARRDRDDRRPASRLFVERYNARTFPRRPANHSDFKGAIVYRAGDASAYVTAASLASTAATSRNEIIKLLTVQEILDEEHVQKM